jgi:hypothetical protein
MPTNRTIRIHVGYDMNRHQLKQAPRDRVCAVKQTGQKAFHPPACHAFTRVLASDDPELKRTIANGETVEIPSIHSGSKAVDGDPVDHLALGEQLQVLLMGVRSKVGVPLHLPFGPVLNGQHTVFKRRVHSGPDLPIGTGADPIAVPSFRVARLPRVQNLEGAGLAAHSIYPKIKPLHVFVARIFSDAQVRTVWSDRFDDFDIARIKMGIDVNGMTSVRKAVGVLAFQ